MGYELPNHLLNNLQPEPQIYTRKDILKILALHDGVEFNETNRLQKKHYEILLDTYNLIIKLKQKTN